MWSWAQLQKHCIIVKSEAQGEQVLPQHPRETHVPECWSRISFLYPASDLNRYGPMLWGETNPHTFMQQQQDDFHRGSSVHGRRHVEGTRAWGLLRMRSFESRQGTTHGYNKAINRIIYFSIMLLGQIEQFHWASFVKWNCTVSYAVPVDLCADMYASNFLSKRKNGEYIHPHQSQAWE